MFRCLHNLAPSYLSELLKLYAPERENLRSSDKLFLDYSIPSTKYGERAFSVSGSVLWNSLPDNFRLLDDIGSFKSKLKTWLFKDAYKKHLWQLLLWQLPLVVLSGSLRLLLLTAFVCYVHVLVKWCVFTCVSFSFITYIIYNPFYASIFLTSTVCVFLCFNLCSTFEYCYRYQRFTNKLLLLFIIKIPWHFLFNYRNHPSVWRDKLSKWSR